MTDQFQLTDDQLAIQDMARKFTADRITPFAGEWDETHHYPVDVWKAAGELGFGAIYVGEESGGIGLGRLEAALIMEAMAYGCPATSAYVSIHNMATWMIDRFGGEEIKARYLPQLVGMEKIASYCLTEPGSGSDAASLRTTARRDGDHYVVRGEKTFITSGMRADFISVAVRTDPAGKGANGVSLLLIEGDTPGLQRTELKKMGWWSSDTAQLRFDNCRVPVGNLIGEEGSGFKYIMHNFNHERLLMAALACAYAQACTEEALEWAQARKTFGAALAERQVIRHKLVDMATRVETARTLVYDLAWRLEQGLGPAAAMVARTCMAKVVSTQAMQFCADSAVQILGGMGFMRGTRSERIYREVKVMMIGGGSEEIMKDLAARQLGI